MTNPNPQRRSGWQKGQSGNPSGRPKVIAEVRDLARQHTAVAMKALVEIAGSPKASESARVSAATVLLDRGWGRPLQQVEVRRTPFDELSPAELRALEAALAALDAEAAGAPGGDTGTAVPGAAGGIPSVH